MMVVVFLPFDRRIKHLRVLLAIRSLGALRFNDGQRRLGFSPTEMGRILRTLMDEQLIYPKVYARRGSRLLLEYVLSRQGEAHLRAVDAYREALVAQRKILGENPVKEVEALLR